LSKEVSDFLGLPGLATNVVVINTHQVIINVGPLNQAARYQISDVLVMNDLPSIGPNFPNAENLSSHEHLCDLIGHFPRLHNERLLLVIGTKETFLSHFTRVRQASAGKLWATKTKLGWVVYRLDDNVAGNNPTT